MLRGGAYFGVMDVYKNRILKPLSQQGYNRRSRVTYRVPHTGLMSSTASPERQCPSGQENSSPGAPLGDSEGACS